MMGSRARILSALGLIVGAGLLAWLVLDRGRPPARSSSRSPAAAGAPSAESIDIMEELAQQVAGPAPTDSRFAARGPALAGRVVDGMGENVEEAAVLWSLLVSDASAVEDSFTERSLSTTTDEDGRFAFEEPLSDRWQGSVIWALHPDFVAAYAMLDSDEGHGVPTQNLTLVAAAPRSARVLVGGEPVAGATVVQSARPQNATGDLVRALSILRREHKTGSDGSVRIEIFPSEESIVGHARGLVSLPHIGPSTGDVVLDLYPTFSARTVIVIDSPIGNVPLSTSRYRFTEPASSASPRLHAAASRIPENAPITLRNRTRSS